MRYRALIAGALACATLATMTPTDADAFCGTYVTSGEGELFNSATNVVLMREGTRTVLSMQNNYKGPAEDFAMLVPVPEVLMQDQVKTLDPEVFRRLDTFTAPRLVEYAEKDPCKDTEILGYCYDSYNESACGSFVEEAPLSGGFEDPVDNEFIEEDPLVKVEAEFMVAEYDIVILSAEEATGLQTWLTANSYNVPAGGEEVLASYIEQGMFFFVARVDPQKVTFDASGQAVLSPLRFDYESEDFSLPIRLGLLNSDGRQDLVVHILSLGQRYEVANYPNALLPTNLAVQPVVADDFAGFYDRLFGSVLRDNPGAVVTEYAWGGVTTQKCDPCPEGFNPFTPTLIDEADVAQLGGDVFDPAQFGGGGEPSSLRWNSMLITRLHARYGKEEIDEDLVFTTAEHLQGGIGGAGRDQLETSIMDLDSFSQFQGRYMIHRRWEEAVECDGPVRGRWIATDAPDAAPSPNTTGAPMGDVQDAEFSTLLDVEIPETEQPRVIPCDEQSADDQGGGACSATLPASANAPVLVMLTLLGMVGWRRRKTVHVSR